MPKASKKPNSLDLESKIPSWLPHGLPQPYHSSAAITLLSHTFTMRIFTYLSQLLVLNSAEITVAMGLKDALAIAVAFGS